MEEISVKLNKIFDSYEEWEQNINTEAKKIAEQMHDLLFPKPADGINKTPIQKNKKKRLTAIADTDDDEDSFLQRKSKSPKADRSSRRPGRAAKTKAESNLKEPDVRHKMRQPEMNTSNASTVSVEITTKQPPILDVGSSDEERDEFKMPPPKLPSTTKPKQRLVIKTEKLSLDQIDASLLPTSESTTSNPSTFSSLSTTSSTETTSASRTRSKKKKNHQPMILVKTEKISDDFDVVIRPRTRSQRNSNKKNSLESVYEDALPGPIPQNATVNLGSNQTSSVGLNSNETLPCNATITIGPNQTVNLGPNATMNMGVNATITLPNKESAATDATFQVVNENNDDVNATNIVSKKSEDEIKVEERRSSNIMTEESDEEIASIVNKHKKKELFNPCIQSPVKKKVEAFEKAALDSPKSTRQGRQKVRQAIKKPSSKENNEVLSLKGTSKTGVLTPSIPTKPVLGRFLTPIQSSNLTPIIAPLKKLPNSTSKITALPKTFATKTLSRENSAEDVGRGYSKVLQSAEEKKKKRELKQQQAAMIREMKEKERLEKLEKLRKKEEEKTKLKAQEKTKKDLDEIQRNLKMVAEKEEQKKRIERQRQEMEEAARKEREHMKALRLREEAEQRRREQQKLLRSKPQQRVLPKYNFDMLHSDDSTDEEDKTSHKRPYFPPGWSLSKNRGPAIDQQAFLSTKFIDSLFSIQPMNVDLEEIFPKIDKKYLKRNSSVIWKTPPRYSEMPKY